MEYRGYDISDDNGRCIVWIGDMPVHDCNDEKSAKIVVDNLVKKEQKKRERFTFD